MANIQKKILKELQIDLTGKFDKNFSHGGFFGNRWKPRKKDGSAAHLIGKGSGVLRRSIQSHIDGDTIVFTSSTPYASIHNEGGKIVVTEKMKKFFWAKAYEAQGKVKNTKLKSGKESKSKSIKHHNEKWNKQAEFYKNLALKKAGSKIDMPQRQFIGEYDGMVKTVERIAFNVLEKELQAVIKKANH